MGSGRFNNSIGIGFVVGSSLIFREKTHEGIKEVVKPFDWSYSTDYRGTLHPIKPLAATIE
jgi:hypothetical protein